MALVSAATLKTHIGISGTSEDTFLTALATQIDAVVKRYVGFGIESTTYPGAAAGDTGDSGYYDGIDGMAIVLRQIPVTAIASIYYDPSGRFGENPDGSFAAATLLVEGTDYVWHKDGCLPGTSTTCSYSGVVDKIPGIWAGSMRYRPGQIIGVRVPNSGAIKVAYTAGYTTVPDDIVLACCQIAAVVRSQREKGVRLQSENLGAYSYSLAQAALGSWPELGGARQILARYRRVVV